MKELKISVITPSFNQGHFIEETIRSIVSQDYPNFEYIIIDGGSTDNTVEIIKKYEKHITYWISEKDNGQSAAINKGFNKSTGDIVCWINSDDMLMPNSLKRVAETFKRDKKLEFINGYTLLIDKESNILFNYFILKQKKWYAKHGIYYVSQPSMFWKRSLLEKIGYLKEDFHAKMDKELLIRIFKSNCKIGQVNKILAAFRVYGESKTGLQGEIWNRDLNELKTLHGNEYAYQSKIAYRFLYRTEKLFKGLYLRDLIFRIKWKGRKVVEINANNCIYLK